MIQTLLIILIFAWLYFYTPFLGQIAPILSMPVITFFSRVITLWDVVIFFLITWIIGILPSPIRQIAFVIFALFVLSLLGIFSFIPGISGILVLLIIIAAFVSLLGVSSKS